MNRPHFQTQMNRLAETFGAERYKRERVELIWREVKDFDDAWLTKVVDTFIGELAHAPLMPAFREEISKERERRWQREKEQERRDASKFAANFNAETIGDICQGILKRLHGGMSDEDFAKFNQMVEGAATGGVQRGCRHCAGEGLVFSRDKDGYEVVFRCFCSAGLQRPRHFATYRGETPFP